MNRVLVVCCSHTGATRRAAQDIAGLVGAEMVDLVEWSLHSSTPCGCPIRGGKQVHDLSAYDLVVAGASPSNACTTECVRVFLAAHQSTLNNVAFFFTLAGSESPADVLDAWSKAAEKEPIASLVIPQAEIETGAVPLEIYRFASDARRRVMSRD